MARFFRPAKKTKAFSPYALNDVLIEGLSDDGRGLARVNGKVFFVDGALPQEKVNVRVTSENSRYCEGVALETQQTSAVRVPAKCPHYASCGGCQVQHMSISDQHEFKMQALVKHLQHCLEISWSDKKQPTFAPTIVSAEYHYRQRVRLAVVKLADKTLLGFRQKSSKQVVNIEQCSVMHPSLEALIKPLQRWLNKTNVAVSHIELIAGEQGSGVVVRHTHSIDKAVRELLQQNLEAFSATCWFQGQKQATLTAVNGENIDPRLFYSLPDYDLNLAFHPQDFIQSNAGVNQQMVAQTLHWLQPQMHECFLDLFCGIGNFSLPLSRLSHQVIGVEGVAAMVSRATENAQLNQCDNAQFLRGDLSKAAVFDKLLPRCHALLLDPPRSGAKVICENIHKLMPKRIVYVSCDSATFARDAQLLCNSGYRLSLLGLMDMFPQTSHSEVMGLFVKPSWKSME